MIFALHDRGMINTAPKPSELEPLFAPYLNRWANYSRTVGRMEPPPERRRVIESSFARLAEIAGQASGGSFEHRISLIMDVMSKPTPAGDSGER
jgi:hypothetical protein